MANFMPSKGKTGKQKEGQWRLQSAARLTGLIMHDFDKRETVTLKELTPHWWGKQRYADAKAE